MTCTGEASCGACLGEEKGILVCFCWVLGGCGCAAEGGVDAGERVLEMLSAEGSPLQFFMARQSGQSRAGERGTSLLAWVLFGLTDKYEGLRNCRRPLQSVFDG